MSEVQSDELLQERGEQSPCRDFAGKSAILITGGPKMTIWGRTPGWNEALDEGDPYEMVRCYWHLEDGSMVHADIPINVLRIGK